MFLCVSITSVEVLKDIGAICGMMVPRPRWLLAADFLPCGEEVVFGHWKELEELSWKGSAGSHRPAATGSSLSCIGSFPSEMH